jgi:hypothetical protein
MSVLRTIESKIEGVFEGIFGRAFRTHVQPVELARKLAKEMDEHRSVSVSRVYVPNEYTVHLSPGDRQQFASYEGSLVGELQEYLTEHAKRESYALLTPPRVTMATDSDLAIGEFGIATRVAQPGDAVPALPRIEPVRPAAAVSIPVAAPPPAVAVAPVPVPVREPVPTAVATDTMVYRTSKPEPEPPESAPPESEPQRATLTVAGRAHPVSTARIVLGRSRESDIRIADDNVSRRHAEVVQEDGAYWLHDLGSTNGTELNGSTVTHALLTDGDRITIGSTEVVFGCTPP